jgi:Sulfotransferase family
VSGEGTSGEASARAGRNPISVLAQLGSRAGIAPGQLDADALMASALKRAGRHDFSDRSFIEPLRRLLAAYVDEADLGLFGRYAARFDVLRCLANLLALEQAEEENPDIRRRPIRRPIFITGLPRSGSTFLHTLLAQDPANAVPRCWQLMYPYPAPTRFTHADRRKARVGRQLLLFRLLSPGLEGLHPLKADAPQECTEITAQIFQSLRFDTTHHVPGYRNWLDGHGHEDAYRFHRRLLQHLDDANASRRWILKCPDHVFALDAIQSVYPDAEIVFLHRDPGSVIASVAKLTELLRHPFTRHINRAAIGRQVTERWVEGAGRMVQASRRPRARPILHLDHRGVVARPMETIAALYGHCGLTLSEEAECRMRAYLAHAPRGGYREHRYSLAEFSLDSRVLREAFEGYRRTFGALEPSPSDGAA